MKKKLLILTSAIVLVITACKTVPVTGRRQISIMPESQLIGMSLTQYSSFLQENKVVTSGTADETLVKSIGLNIQKSVEAYMAQENLSKEIADYQWEFNLVEDDAVNAWCMPGGKVVVYTGLLKVTQTPEALACVMGHEIAHAIARHGNERMSQGMLLQMGGVALQTAMSQKPAFVQGLLAQSYGMTSKLGTLKFSRTHESEADKMGLIFMAMAGYDPTAAIGFWQRMSAASGGQKPPEIMSTHPSDETRIADIKAFLPEALKYYRK